MKSVQRIGIAGRGLLVATLLLIGCGKSGPLYLPEPASTENGQAAPDQTEQDKKKKLD